MPFVIAFLVGGLLAMLSSFVGRILLTLGLAYVTYTGFDLASTWLLNQLKGNMGGMPIEALQFLSFLWVDKAIGMVFSAYTAAVSMKLINGSGFTKLVMS